MHLRNLMRCIQVKEPIKARQALEAMGILVVSDGRDEDVCFAVYIPDPAYDRVMHVLQNPE